MPTLVHEYPGSAIGLQSGNKRVVVSGFSPPCVGN